MCGHYDFSRERQDWPKCPVPLWQRKEVQALLFEAAIRFPQRVGTTARRIRPANAARHYCTQIVWNFTVTTVCHCLAI
jgi:hypothetical protein